MTNSSLNQRKVVLHTLTGLKRWSCHSRELPRKLHELPTRKFTNQETAVSQVKALHVYDFDNTCWQPSTPKLKTELTYSSVHESLAKSKIME